MSKGVQVRSTLKNVYGIATLWAMGFGLALAHHSFAMFDQSKQTTLVGTVKEFQWTNPHCWVMLEVKSSEGELQEWSLEALSPNVLGRQGWKKNSIKPGERVTVIVNPTRNGTHGGNLLSVTNEAGQKIGGAGS
jgi:hypothetical protein